MRPIRVLVVDDEKPACRRLLELLKQEPRAEVVGMCTSGKEAVRAVEEAEEGKRPVEVMFLDVQMPEMDGFVVLNAIQARVMPMVVFVTAYDQYALRAFDAHAIDYLLKPYSDERFTSALDRAIHYLRSDGAAEVVSRFQALLEELRHERPHLLARPEAARPLPGPAQPYLDRIALREGNRVRLLPVEEITWIEAEGVYVTFHTSTGRSYLHRALLGEMEVGLDPRRFVRIHRSAIINIEAVEELRVGTRRDYTVRLKDGTELRLSRTYRNNLQERLGQSL
jgi:two-component system LytT family response regulator